MNVELGGHCVFCGLELTIDNVGIMIRKEYEDETKNHNVSVACWDCTKRYVHGTRIVKEAMMEQALEIRVSTLLDRFLEEKKQEVKDPDTRRFLISKAMDVLRKDFFDELSTIPTDIQESKRG